MLLCGHVVTRKEAVPASTDPPRARSSTDKSTALFVLDTDAPLATVKVPEPSQSESAVSDRPPATVKPCENYTSPRLITDTDEGPTKELAADPEKRTRLAASRPADTSSVLADPP